MSEGLFDGSLIQEQDAHHELQDLRDKVRALTEELAEANEAATAALNRHSDTCDGELAKLREALEKERASSRRLSDLNFEMKGTITALRQQLAASSLVPRKLANAIYQYMSDSDLPDFLVSDSLLIPWADTAAKEILAGLGVPFAAAAAVSAEEFAQVKHSLLYVLRALKTGKWALTVDAELSALEKALGGA